MRSLFSWKDHKALTFATCFEVVAAVGEAVNRVCTQIRVVGDGSQRR